MKRTILLSLLVLCSAAVADAETYNWTDDQGVVNFTDDPAQIPAKYRSKALKKVKDITVPSTTRQQEEKVLKDELTTPRSVTTPDSGPSPAPQDMQQPTPAPVPAPLGDQPVPAPLGDKPMPAPLGDQSIPVPLGDPPAPAQ